ncbi:1-deoxy-D-xylulose 5-phosphate reductoisomerase [Dyadobacter sp. CECT 9623]|uniref:1-deoxy-D-xylulose 5-phosphate reductoisomerase n=1 Tax=Dyadobacter linearis TaxID=2823330 RepID=A0ABM8UU97_9BACT|nr:1-deoxy-D-xylulose-5-phosphate reductoisomerase [Dyadobacter sp. CECT 9623]CAG5071923.1 1-deoxy-D-xylulose 5-phosphate reductoisomerase [Dyadobacter sp. CECT 9623]
MKKRIAILGSTGSIGTQALEVIAANPEVFSVSVLTAGENADLLIEQAVKFLPDEVVICSENKFDQVKSALAGFPVKVYKGAEALVSVVESDEVDIVLTAMVGYAGLLPTIHAIKAGKTIALANKETLVVAGELITALAKQYQVNIYPVDSEHAAIFQCLTGEENNPIEKIILTASGGPFRGRDKAFLASVTKAQALKHPNWSMGAKITIDSATLMNKGLEVIEAKWLFDLKASQIEVIVHPQSIIHSLVQFEDGSMKAQMGLPDMKLPIQYALYYPLRLKSDFPRFNFVDYPSLTFEKPDLETFRNLAIAYEVLEKGGNAACIVNAANEIAVDAFLHDKIGFLDISDVIVESLAKIAYVENPSYTDYVQTNEATRRFASEMIQVKV